jgi:hypothetical protein
MSNWSIDFAPFLPGPFFVIAVIIALATAMLVMVTKGSLGCSYEL